MKKLFEYTRIWEVLITTILCATLFQTNFLPWLTEVGLDLMFQTRSARETSQSVVIVGVDEESLEQYGPWPFQRDLHGRLLEKLEGASAIGFDFIFSGATDADTTFDAALNENLHVVVAAASSYQRTLLKPEPIFSSSQVKLGHIETELGIDGIIRRVQLEKHDLPVLALAMAEAAGKVVSVTGTNDSKGTLINFYGPEFSFLYLSYSDVLRGEYKADFFQDRLVLVGSKAIVMGDVHITPYSSLHPTPGVEVQATILNNILDDTFLKELDWLVWFLCAMCIFFLIAVWPSRSETYNAISSFLFAALTIISAVILFRYDYFLNFLVPLLVLFLGYLVHTIFWWIKIATGMIREIRALDIQLEDRVERLFMTLPSSLDNIPAQGKPLKLTTGIQKHINRMHRGIQALELQNNFINHLLREETPPLILWEKDSGLIVLASNRFAILWKERLEPEAELPELGSFFHFLSDKTISDSEEPPTELGQNQFDFGTVDRTVDILTSLGGQKAYHRVVIHTVEDSELNFQGILASFTDVTEIRELERLKSEVMNIVSHELKLPLTTIMGFAEMLTESLDGDEKEFAGQIKNQSARLAKMIEDFLDIARIESGKYLINKYPFDLLAVIHDAASGVAIAASRKEIELRYELPQKVSALLGDESLIAQVVLNLLDNAVKFSPVGTTVVLSVIEEVKVVRIIVEDGGKGIADAEKTRVLEKFIRGSDQVKGSGFGLGLSFVKEVVEGHSGRIDVSDSSLGGAKFTIQLPKTI